MAMAKSKKRGAGDLDRPPRRRAIDWPRGTVVVETIESRALRGNVLGDPHVRHVPVYLPPGYETTRRRYPVLVALTGFTGAGRMLLNASPWGEPLSDRLDRLQGLGKMGPVIVAMPDCFTRYGGSQYVNSSATGRYEDHLIDEVVPAIEARFRTLAAPEHRGVFGKSSGGYGAIVLALRHPDVFGAVACHSGDMAFEYCYLPDFPKFLGTVAKHDGLLGFLRAFDAAPRKTRELVDAMNILAMAACYAPNPRRKPLGIDLPVDLETGALDAAVWARWLQHDPLRMAPEHVAELRRLRLLFIDCGTRDEFNLQWGARQLAAALRRLDVPHLHEEFDDGHMDITYRFDRSLPLLWEALRGS
jgi:enterochelin esterase family protein